MHFAEFFERYEIAVPKLDRKALVWGHCHHKATGGMDLEHKLLQRMGMEIEPVSGGCCGLAGSWGFERGHFDVSMKSAELTLLPAVRNTEAETIIVANGFSCKTQIQQSDVGRQALHVAQVIKMAREHGPEGVSTGKPEAPYYGAKPPPSGRVRVGRVAAAGAGILTAAAAVAAVTRRGNRR
jgi:Fe-S oxidoreductase